MAEICNFFDGYIFIIMCGDIPDDTFQFLFMLIALRRLVYFWRVRNQQVYNLDKPTLDKKLIRIVSFITFSSNKSTILLISVYNVCPGVR